MLSKPGAAASDRLPRPPNIPAEAWEPAISRKGATGVFGDEAKAEPAGPTVDVKTLHAKIGELTLENDFLSGALGKAGLLSGKK
jgi:hypothetical protein